MKLDLRCDCDCGLTALVAVAPGTEPEACDLFTLTRGEPLRCWCSLHWPALVAHVAEPAEARP